MSDVQIEVVSIHSPVGSLGYKWSVDSGRPFIDNSLWRWCMDMFGSMRDGGWIDQGRDVCFKDLDNAKIFWLSWCA